MRGDEPKHFLLHPPEPPFVACVKTANNQHLIWRARPTLDVRAIFVQLGGQSLLIRHDILVEDIMPAIRELRDELGVRSPFLSQGFELVPRVAALGGRIPSAIAHATNGERWAANILLTASDPEPPRLLIARR
ncbi:MAG: hypothetical protein D6771_09220 [Zetaproteobacteria bacterium]|nr:MAG: hypothetical protein D6771_09220 [Zetaproteobacteria bacterium]